MGSKIIEYIRNKNSVDAYTDLTKYMGFTENEASSILEVKTFKSLNFNPHRVVPKAVSAVVYLPLIDKGNGGWFSVVGGESGLYGDGYSSFEVLSEDINEPKKYLSKEQVTYEMLKRQKTQYEL
jgi:hypothetical protein